MMVWMLALANLALAGEDPASTVWLDKAPRAVESTPPEYPPAALRAGREGRVRLELSIADDGLVTTARVVEDFPEGIFADNALEAVRQWRFEPVHRDGEPVPATFSLEIEFRPDAGPVSVGMWTTTGWPRSPGPTEPAPAVTQAVPVHTVPPSYPRKARIKGIEGWVEVRVTVDEKGRVTQATAVNAEPADIFDAKALQAVRRWRFTPATKSGEPVSSTFDFRVTFLWPDE